MPVLFLLFVVFAFGCASPPRDNVDEKFNFWPIARYETVEQPPGHALDVLWPLARFQESGDARHSRILPFYWHDEDGQGKRFTNVLVLYWQERNEETGGLARTLLPLFSFEMSVSPDRLDASFSYRVLFLPFLFSALAGSTDSGRSYDGSPFRSERLGMLCFLGNLFSVYHGRVQIDETTHGRPVISAERSLLDLWLLTLWDAETSPNGDHRQRLFGLLDFDVVALATSVTEHDVDGQFTSSHAHVFPVWFQSRHQLDGGVHERDWYGGPLLALERNPSDHLFGIDVLFPLFRYDRSGEAEERAWHVRALPLAWFTRRPDSSASLMFPFYYHLRDDGNDYLHVVPLFGRHEEADGAFRRLFVVPPLYIRTTDRRLSLARTEFLFPLTRFETSRDGSMNRVFPLWYRKEFGARVHLNVLGLIDIENSDVRESFMLYPLFSNSDVFGEGTRRSWLPLLDLRYVIDPIPAGDETAFLYPWASFRRDRGVVTEWIFPCYWRHDDGVLESWFHVWPLFGMNERGHYREFSFIYPLFFAGSDDTGVQQATGFLYPLSGSRRDAHVDKRWIAWLYHDTRTRDTKRSDTRQFTDAEGDADASGADSRETNILWPLFHYERNADGSTLWHSLFYMLRSEHESAPEGGAQEFAILGGLYRSRSEGDELSRSVPFLFGYHRDGNQSTLKLFHLIPIGL